MCIMSNTMPDLHSKGWIAFKGVAFLGIALTAAGLLLMQNPTLWTGVLLGLLAWAAARFYYFLFYVLERYVDPRLKYAGLIALARAIMAKKG